MTPKSEQLAKIEELAVKLADERFPMSFQVNDRSIANFLVKQGAMAAFALIPDPQGLVEVAQRYLNAAPVDGWHFSDCDAAEDNYDELMPCSCGVGAKEIDLVNAIAAFKDPVTSSPESLKRLDDTIIRNLQRAQKIEIESWKAKTQGLVEALELILIQNEGFPEDFAERAPQIAFEALAAFKGAE